MRLWHKAAIVFSVGWIVVLGLYLGIPAYHQLTCTPTVQHLPDGTIFRQACVGNLISRQMIVYAGAYIVGGVALISLLSWLFLGWPADAVSGFFGRRTRGKNSSI
jgi:hypothetical protein